MSRMVIVLTDHAFPLAFPSQDGRKCLVSIRIENVGLAELVSYLFSLTEDTQVPIGSVILLTSASQLAILGTAAYAEELRVARGRISHHYRGAVDCVPVPPMLLQGTNSAPLIRYIGEIGEWVQSLVGTEATLAGMFPTVMEGLIQRGTGGKQAAVTHHMCVPVSMRGEGSRLVVSVGKDDLPAASSPMSDYLEAKITKKCSIC